MLILLGTYVGSALLVVLLVRKLPFPLAVWAMIVLFVVPIAWFAEQIGEARAGLAIDPSSLSGISFLFMFVFPYIAIPVFGIVRLLSSEEARLQADRMIHEQRLRRIEREKALGMRALWPW